MANLIPPDAKRAVVTEYWLRVVTAWFVLIGLGFIAVTLLRVPTFVLVESQLRAFSGAYDEAVDKTKAFDEAQATIIAANDLSHLLTVRASTTALSDVIAILEGLAGSEVRINDLNFTTEDGTLTEVTVRGVAETRISLAEFNKDIEAHPLFTDAELPISNLAKNRDIGFSINITPSEDE